MEQISPHVYVSTAYRGVNVGCIVLPKGVIAVDAPTLPEDAREWRQQILDLTGGPILYLIVTDGHPDRLLSAGLMEAPVVAARAVYDRAAAYTDGFWRSVIETWCRRCPEASDDLSRAHVALPEIMFTESITLSKGGRDITVRAWAGPAPGTAMVRLPEEKVLFTGDALVVSEHPTLTFAPDTQAWLRTLTTLRRPRFAGTRFVPGRGPVSDQEATRPLSAYIALARRRVRYLIKAGGSRSDVTGLVAELMPLFPIPEGEHDRVQRRIKAGLEHIYDELQRQQTD